MRIVLINAPLASTVCDRTTGHQIPLGLLMIGGPLIEAGHDVCLIDAAALHLEDAEIVRRAANADVILIAHVGSTQAHPCCMRVLRAIRQAQPGVFTIYGGVHPTYHYKEILERNGEVDVIVCGEGEATTPELIETVAEALGSTDTATAFNELDLRTVKGIAWRKADRVVRNANRPVIENLDAYRIAWELIQDWDIYQAFGHG